MLDNYFVDPFGVIHQRCIGKFEKDYATQYNNYGELSNYMGYLRYAYIRGVVGNFGSVLDIGYGNGAFLKVCQEAGVTSYGYDISDYPVPEGCKKVKDIKKKNPWYQVVTMFDSLEHFEDLSFVDDIPASNLVISVPNCNYGYDDEWFKNWKHRRPDEHLHHFNRSSLQAYIEYGGNWKMVTSSYVEDAIRKDPNVMGGNILTMVFKR